MSDESPGSQRDLEEYREYLRLLVQIQIDPLLQGKIDASGVVQQTMLEAHQALPQYRVENADHLAAWLRRILANNLADEIRKLRTGKREVSRERALDAAVEHSSQRLDAWLAREQSSPSGPMQREEQSLRLSAALAKLPEAQQQALVLRHFQDWPLAQIAKHLDRSHAAVAGLLKRGLQKLRTQLTDET